MGNRLKSVLSILFIIFFVGNIFAEEKKDSTEIFGATKWSLQFGIFEDFTLGSFAGQSIACTKRINNKNSLRIGIVLYNNSQFIHNNVDKADTMGTDLDDKSDLTYFKLAATFSFITNTKVKDNLRLYYGKGFGISETISYNKHETDRKLPAYSIVMKKMNI